MRLIPSCWILLDSQSTVDLFINKNLLKKICDTKKLLTLRCNAGMTTLDKIVDLVGYGTIWYYKDGIAIKLSRNNFKKMYHVTYDSAFEVHKE